MKLIEWLKPSHILYSSAFFFMAALYIIYPLVMRGYFDITICRNDCTDYHNYSNHLLENGKFVPTGSDPHSSMYHRGFVALIATLKAGFAEHWGRAYILMNAVLLFCFTVVGTKILNRHTAWFAFMGAIFFASFNLELLYFSGYLLTDFLFALICGIVLLSLAVGSSQNKLRFLIIAFLFSIFGIFIRANGVFLLGYCLAFLCLHFFPNSYRRLLIFGIPLLMGGGMMIFSANLTAYFVKQWDSLASLSPNTKANIETFLRTNYLGTDAVIPDNRLGLMVHNNKFEWDLNDGSAWQIFRGFLKRIPQIFEIVPYPLARTHNIIYRYTYSSFLYLFVFLYMGYAIRFYRQRPQHLLLVLLFLAHLMTFISVSHVEIRYTLQFQILLIIAAASTLQFLWEDVSRFWQRKKEGEFDSMRFLLGKQK